MTLKRFLHPKRQFFIAEYYFRQYGFDRSGGPGLAQTTNEFQQRFHKLPPSIALMLVIVEHFHVTGGVLTQRKGSSGRRTTVAANESHGRLLGSLSKSDSLRKEDSGGHLKSNISCLSTSRMFKHISASVYKIEACQSLNLRNKKG